MYTAPGQIASVITAICGCVSVLAVIALGIAFLRTVLMPDDRRVADGMSHIFSILLTCAILGAFGAIASWLWSVFAAGGLSITTITNALKL